MRRPALFVVALLYTALSGLTVASGQARWPAFDGVSSIGIEIDHPSIDTGYPDAENRAATLETPFLGLEMDRSRAGAGTGILTEIGINPPVADDLDAVPIRHCVEARIPFGS